MKDVYVTERMEEMDRNRDGKVSLDEYMSKSQCAPETDQH